MADGINSFKAHFIGLKKLQLAATAMRLSQSLRYKLWNKLEIGNNYTQEKDGGDSLISTLEEFDSVWNSFRFGSAFDGYQSMTDYSSSMKDLILQKNNMSCDEFNCLSLDDQVAKFRSNILMYKDLSQNLTVSHIGDYHSFLRQDSFELVMTFSNITQLLRRTLESSRSLMTIVVVVICCPVLLIASFFLFTNVSTMQEENFRMRKLFNYVQWEIIDANDEIRNYIFFYYLSSGVGRAKVKQKISKERAVLEAALTCATICSAGGTIDIFNSSSEKLFGYRGDQIIGFHLSKLFDKESASKLEPILAKMAFSAVNYAETIEITGQKKNQSKFPLELRISVGVLDGRNIIACFMRDITEYKKQTKELAEEKKKSESLLLNIMPESIAQRLIAGETFIADKYENVTCFFSDLYGLLDLNLSAYELVQTLNLIIHKFDDLTLASNVEKIKTIGSKYFCCGGLKPDSETELSHLERMFDFAIQLFDIVDSFRDENGLNIGLKVGMHVGPVVAGICGLLKYAFDIWGDTVNIASRMESTCPTGHIQITSTCYHKLKDFYKFQEKSVEVKGKGLMQTYLFKPARNSASPTVLTHDHHTDLYSSRDSVGSKHSLKALLTSSFSSRNAIQDILAAGNNGSSNIQETVHQE
ncbi:hypothetical protein FDP41_010148 [Naegleria fowleri]|nr:uncharacterized protein FDP41_010148 [Naegleria fowleri]KAF0971542.1 hypothetical protein FDP41_010148 [Naegleria fowleri]